MIRHRDGQIKAAEPAVGEVEMNLLAKTALGSDAHDVTHQQHADHQFRIDRRPSCRTVERCQVLPDTSQVDEPINRSKHVVRRDMCVDRELV